VSYHAGLGEKRVVFGHEIVILLISFVNQTFSLTNTTLDCDEAGLMKKYIL